MRTKLTCSCLFLVLLGVANSAQAQGTAFTYQGRLNNNANPASGSYDLRFTIYDSSGGSTVVAGPLTNAATVVSNGLFAVTLDFGANVFTGPARWLDIAVRTNGSGSFAGLSPRQSMLPAPYAIFAGSASNVAGGSVVQSLNSLKDNVTLAAGANVTITPSGNTLTITSTGAGGGGIWSLNGSSAFYNGGNVGIGTNSPVSKLHVVSSANDSPPRLQSSGTAGFGAGWDLYQGGVGKGYVGVPDAAAGIAPGEMIVFGSPGTRVSLWPGTARALTMELNGDATLPGNINFGSTTRQMLNMFGTGFGIGIQTADLYFRTGTGFAWHVGGVHSNTTYDSGGGTTVATLDLNTGLDFGSRLGQHISLWGGIGARRFDIGMQAETIYFRTGNGVGDAFAWYKGGIHDGGHRNAGGGQTLMTLDGETGLFVGGPASVCTLTIRGGCDLAEPFPMKEQEIEKGSVVVIDKEHPGQLQRSAQAYDKRVAGIVSGGNGINSGISLHQEGLLEGGQNVALSGRVYVLADAGNGAIEPGDLLTTSDRPGHAMKVTDQTRAQGAILGKAMSGLKSGQGMVLVLVTLQ